MIDFASSCEGGALFAVIQSRACLSFLVLFTCSHHIRPKITTPVMSTVRDDAPLFFSLVSNGENKKLLVVLRGRMGSCVRDKYRRRFLGSPGNRSCFFNQWGAAAAALL